MNDLRIVPDATCIRCGCLCDDIALGVRGEEIVEARNACDLGREWFLGGSESTDEPACRICGRAASVEDGVEEAARLLIAARYPLVYGLTEATSEAQRFAVAIADWISGTVDTPTSHRQGPTSVAFQGVGEVTCSLGELKNRCDLVVFWRADPTRTHPRHFERYSLLAEGMFVPRGRADRTCVVVDVERTPAADAADVFILIKPAADFEALWLLRGLLKGLPLSTFDALERTGIELSVWQALAERMKHSRFGVLLTGADLPAARSRHLNIEAIFALTRDLNAHTRFVCHPLREPGNAMGADNVVAWQTGFPFGANMARGYPRFNPGEYTATDMLSRGECDAALIVATDAAAELDAAARRRLSRIPVVAVHSRETDTLRAATVAFRTSKYGIHSEGTVYRSDDVPLPLRVACASRYPSDEAILAALAARVRELARPAADSALQSI